MAHGIELYNDNGEKILDTSHKLPKLYQSGDFEIEIEYYMYEDESGGVVNVPGFVSEDIDPPIDGALFGTIRCDSEVGATMFSVTQNEDDEYAQIDLAVDQRCGTDGTFNVYYNVYSYKDVGSDGEIDSGYGIEIYTSDGEIVFSSNHKTLRAIDVGVITLDSYDDTEKISVPSDIDNDHLEVFFGGQSYLHVRDSECDPGLYNWWSPGFVEMDGDEIVFGNIVIRAVDKSLYDWMYDDLQRVSYPWELSYVVYERM